jgi:hypothetical protein
VSADIPLWVRTKEANSNTPKVNGSDIFDNEEPSLQIVLTVEVLIVINEAGSKLFTKSYLRPIVWM